MYQYVERRASFAIILIFLFAVFTVSSLPSSVAALEVPNSPRTLLPGMQGNDVAVLQQFLMELGYLSVGNASGYFGVLTESAVKKYQAAHSIVKSGTPLTTGYGAVGPKTKASMQTYVSSDPTPQAEPLPSSSLPSPKQPTAPQSLNVSLQCQEYSTQQAGDFVTRTCNTNVAILRWAKVDGANYCTATTNASGSVWSGTKPIVSTETVETITAPRVYTLTCYGSGGAWGKDSITVQPVAMQNAPCAFNDSSIAHGASVTAYQSSSVPAGQQCVSQLRTCANGVLRGTYGYASCTPGSGTASCTLDGVTVSHGASRTFFSALKAAGGSSCAAISQNRTCKDGVLNGSASYKIASCQELPALKVDLQCQEYSTQQAGDFVTRTCNTNVAILRWAKVDGANYCTATTNASGSVWSGTKPIVSTETVETITAPRLYTLTCYGSGGVWGEDSITVEPPVTKPPPPPPPPPPPVPPTLDVELKCWTGKKNADGTLVYSTGTCYNSVAILRWSLVSGATSCTASTGDASGAWKGTKPFSSTETVEIITKPRVYTLTCTGPGVTWGTDSITVNPNPQALDDSSLSNLASVLTALESAVTALLELFGATEAQ